MTIREEFYKSGFFLFRNVLPRCRVESILDEMREIFSLGGLGGGDAALMELFSRDPSGFLGCAKACQNLVSIAAIASCKELVECLKAIGIGLPGFNTRPLVSFSHRLTAQNEYNWRVPAHQDWPSVQGSLNGVTCWMPLVDVDEEIGPLEIVPGSHRLGYIDHNMENVPCLEKENLEGFLPQTMKVGDLLIFNSFTIHRSGTNVSPDRIRISAHFRYNDILEPTFVERQMPVCRTDVIHKDIKKPGWPSAEEMEVFISSQIKEANQIAPSQSQ